MSDDHFSRRWTQARAARVVDRELSEAARSELRTIAAQWDVLAGGPSTRPQSIAAPSTWPTTDDPPLLSPDATVRAIGAWEAWYRRARGDESPPADTLSTSAEVSAPSWSEVLRAAVASSAPASVRGYLSTVGASRAAGLASLDARGAVGARVAGIVRAIDGAERVWWTARAARGWSATPAPPPPPPPPPPPGPPPPPPTPAPPASSGGAALAGAAAIAAVALLARRRRRGRR